MIAVLSYVLLFPYISWDRDTQSANSASFLFFFSSSFSIRWNLLYLLYVVGIYIYVYM
uniref:Uncharacterized protein n=1 Tax=Lepeophtheirus salmonis TaxID=72036 RepID=A0A0K2T1E5_LEPSM